MNILIIGGSYFLGRVFTMIADSSYHITMVNRGKYSMPQHNIIEYHFDRHDINQWKNLPIQDFDVVIDFCAYNPKDIETIIENYPGNIKKYILISTCDVYQRQTGLIKDETHPIETRKFSGEVGEYIHHKIELENELIYLSDKHNFHYVIIRPGLIYGPFNYAPRESEYIKLIVNNSPLISLTNQDGLFQMVYVKDVAKAILLCCNKNVVNQQFNVIGPEILNYQKFYKALEQASNQSIEYIPMTIDQAIKHNYPLPFPVTQEETELYDGSLITQKLGLEYTSLKEGISKTYQAFLPVFQHK